MKIPVHIEPAAGALPEVDYRWDADTEILIAAMRPNGGGKGTPSAPGSLESVEIVGSDGSWLVLDVDGGRISGIEVAVWPDVRTLATLTPPADAPEVHAVVAPRRAGAAVEVDAPLAADADAAERTIHFRVGARRQTRAVRIARDVLLDVDASDHVAGVWLLNVPPLQADPADL